VSLKVYDIAGRLVRTLVSDKMREGIYSVEWDGTDVENRNVANGMYFYQLRAQDRTLSRKLVLIR
jgi:flagellar hook assembly protein FlgD